MTKLFFEKSYPLLFAAIAGIIWHELSIPFPKTDALLSATLSVSGIFVGFLATTKAILIALDNQIIRSIKQSGYVNELVSYISQAIWFNLAFCTLNVIGFFGVQECGWFQHAWIILGVAALMSFVRITHIMLQIFKSS